MAIKCRITFFAYNGGREIQSVSGATFVNTFDEAEQKMRDFVEEHYPTEAQSVTILENRKSEAVGAWQIFARSDIDPDFYFSFIINKL